MDQNPSVNGDDAGAPDENRRSSQFRAQHAVPFFPHVINLMNSVGTLWIFLLMFVICANVLSRAFLNTPITGVIEFAGYSLVGAVFLQLASTLHNNRFTRADMLLDHLGRKNPDAAAVYHVIFGVFGMIVFGLIAWGTYGKLLRAWPDDVFGVENRFTMLVWPLRAIVMAGAIAVFAEFFFQTLTHLSRLLPASWTKTRFGQCFSVPRPADDGDGDADVDDTAGARRKGWGHIAALLAFFAIVLILSQVELTRLQIGGLSFIGMLALIYFGMHIGVALILLGFGGLWMMMGTSKVGMSVLTSGANEFLRNDLFATVPLFVLMGLLVNASDVGKDTFDAARWALRRVKGGLGVATVAANAIFAAITGSSIASAAVFTKIATPHMIDAGYTPRFAVGTVAGSSVLGVLIPPSLLLIVYGFVTEQSVGELFIAAVIPGLLLATVMGLSIIAMAYLWPSFVGEVQSGKSSRENLLTALYKLMPIIVLVTAVIGGIYAGIFTPVEAGAVGSALALILMIVRRRFSVRRLWDVLIETGHISVAVLFLIVAARVYTNMLALSGLPQEMGGLISGTTLGYLGFMALYILVLIILGMFLDSISIMLVILPLVIPIAETLGVDLVAFGIITVVGLEMGLLTPPLGLCVYVVKSTLDDARVSLADIFVGSAPFVVIMLAVVILLVFFPVIANTDPADPFRWLLGLFGSGGAPAS